MAKINVLDAAVYNMIAAGQVVDAPVNVVKELVENSLDAGATKITIMVEGGGTERIRVIDNGSGIEKSQVRYAFMPHSTSKISKVEDIYNINTLGFRGEALASISFISRVILTTRTRDEDVGTRFEMTAGEFEKQSDVAANVGTDIEIYNLFFNTPARYRFLRGKNVEVREITKAIVDMAIANPKVQFDYRVEGQQLLKTDGNGLASAIGQTGEKTFVDKCIYIDKKNPKYRLYGYVSLPGESPSLRIMKSFINGRIVYSECIMSAVQSAYTNFLMKGALPSYILFLEVPPEELDVNISPQKTVVKFKDDYDIYAWVSYAVKESFVELLTAKEELDAQEYGDEDDDEQDEDGDSNEKEYVEGEKLDDETRRKFAEELLRLCDATGEYDVDEIANIPKKEKTESAPTGLSASFDEDGGIKDEKPAKEEIKEEVPNVAEINSVIEKPKEEEPEVKKAEFDCSVKEIDIETFKEYCKGSSQKVSAGLNSESDIMNKVRALNANSVKQQFSKEAFVKGGYKVLGVVFQTYVVVQGEEELFLIDQHAAHEKFLYDKYMGEIERQDITIQNLLVPFAVSADNDLAGFLENNLEELNKLGFKVTCWGSNIFKFEAVPMILSDINLGEFIDDIFQNKLYLTNVNEQLRNKIATRACKNAVKAGMDLNQSEIDSLMEMIKNTNTPLLCPHGRPYVLKISKKDIEKWFKRIV